MVTEVGGKAVNHGAANTLPFEGAVSHLLAGLSLERLGGRERLGRRAGESRRRENYLLI